MYIDSKNTYMHMKRIGQNEIDIRIKKKIID